MFERIDVATPPAVEPVTTDELKVQGRIDDPPADVLTAHNALLERLIKAARLRGESFTRRSFITQTLDVWFSRQDGLGVFDLPRGNVQSIEEIGVYDDYGVQAVIETDIYSLGNNLALFSSWLPYYRAVAGIRIRIVSGYGDAAEDVPENLRQGILAYAVHLFENRAGEAPDLKYQAQATGAAGLPLTVIGLWEPYQIIYT